MTAQEAVIFDIEDRRFDASRSAPIGRGAADASTSSGCSHVAVTISRAMAEEGLIEAARLDV